IGRMLVPQLPAKPEPRWPGWLAMFAVGGLIYALPSALSIGPDWLVLVLMAGLQLTAMFLHFRRKNGAAQAVSYAALSVGTVALIGALVLLVLGIPSHRETPVQLLQSATMLWISNLLIFASW